MAKHTQHDVDPTYEGMSYTEKGPAYYPGETKQGAAGANNMSAMPGGGNVNLSPPNARSMGGAMTGSGLPPANGIRLDMAGNSGNPQPPGPTSVDPMMRAGESPLPPGPEVDPGPAVRCPLPPGVPVGGHGEGDRRTGSPGRGHSGGDGGGQLPPGTGV